MDGISAAKLMELFNAQTATVNTLWNIFSAVALGVLGFTLKEKDLRTSRSLKPAFTVAFVIFALGNIEAISRSQKILVAIADTLNVTAGSAGRYSSVLLAYEVPSVADIRRGHHVITALVVLLMWLPDLAAFVKRRQGTAVPSDHRPAPS